jgi:hypothetical protein
MSLSHLQALDFINELAYPASMSLSHLQVLGLIYEPVSPASAGTYQ